MLPRAPLAATAVVGLVLGLGGCGAHEDEPFALAIRSATRTDAGVVLEVECASDLVVEQRLDPAGSGLQQVVVWGRPEMGRCTGTATADDLRDDRFVDAATSQVVEVSPASRP